MKPRLYKDGDHWKCRVVLGNGIVRAGWGWTPLKAYESWTWIMHWLALRDAE